MSLLEALRRDCELWPGTQESLSRDVCGSAQGLRHKLSGYKGAVAGLEDAQTVMLLTSGRNTIIEQARELGGVFVQLPPPHEIVDNTDLLAECQTISMRLAELFGAVNETITQQGRVDKTAEKAIEGKALALRDQVTRYLTLLLMVYGTGK